MKRLFLSVSLTLAASLCITSCAAEKQQAECPPPAPAPKVECPACPACPAVAAPAPAATPAPEAAKVEEKKEAAAPAPAEGGPKKAVELQFYIMSQCPFGVQVLDGVIPALKKLGDVVDLKVDFIGSIDGETLSSMHGEAEVAGDIVELCSLKYAPAKWQDMFLCWNKDYRSLPGNWKGCATGSGLDSATMTKLTECVDGKEGKELLKASFEKAMKAGAEGSPTIKINGQDWTEGRDEVAFIKGICGKLPDPKPEVCTNLPKPVAVTALVINDKRCTDKTCNTAPIVGSLKNVFPGLEVKELDWGTPEGKAAYTEHGLDFLPAIIFDESVTKDSAGMEKVRPYLRPTKKDKFQLLMIEAYHDPNKEICDNKVDDTANGKIDCDDDDCKSKLICRPEVKGDLQVFVMTHCPFGIRAMNAMKEVLKAFGTEIKFDIHYIVTDTGTGFEGMHGPQEVEEAIRQLCIKKLYPANYKVMDYIWCRAVKMQETDPVKCMADTGIEKAKVDECVTKDGNNLLREDAKIAAALNIGASPTWLINNKTTFGGIDPLGVQKGICDKNPEFNGCKTPLPGEPPPSMNGGGNGGGSPSCGG